MSTHVETNTEIAPCRVCQSPVFDDELFCEACGTPVTPEAAASVPLPRQPVQRAERDLSVLASVSDIGHRRRRNEDAVAIAGGDGRLAAAVCDGVASTANGDLAARAAADAVLAVLEGALTSSESPEAAALEALFEEAFDDAQRAVLLVPADDSRSANDASPSTTLVAAVATPERVVVGNVGDSRAYWLSTDSARCTLLTVDDSWALEHIAEGTPPEEAYAHPEANTITRWIGGETDSWSPRLTVFEVDEPGLLVLCTDGLWNHFEDPVALAALVPAGTPSPVEVARALTDAALDAGGRDNITVAVIPVIPQPNGSERPRKEEQRHG
jgi:serine/threonine protein phosphatase PrpC